MLWSLGWSWQLILPPLYHEVDYCLRLDGCSWLEVDVEGAELDYPLGDSSSSILVPQDVTERIVGDDGDRVLLEVMS
jgi:hypothetical protein